MASETVNTPDTQARKVVGPQVETGLRVGFLISHPIQYLSPLLRELDSRVDLHVFYAHDPSPEQQAEAGFDVEFEWDTNLLGGYDYTFLENKAQDPDARAGSFFGCDTPGIYGQIRADAFDAFIVNGWYLKSYWQAVWACRRAGVPVFARGDSQLHVPNQWWKRIAKRIGYPILLRAFDGFLSVGARFDEYLRHYRVPPNRIHRAPHAVDNSWFASRAKKAEQEGRPRALRDELGLLPDDHILLFVGKFISVKRAEDILRALDVLETRNVDVSAIYVGAGPQEKALRSKAQRLGVSAHFVGFKNQSELPAYYALADALVLPSKSETWGLVVNEAMACGTPAIVSEAVGCRPDLIVDGETGYGYPMGDVEALADVTQQLIAEREQGHDFSAVVTRRIEGYSPESATKHIVKAIQSVVSA
ncbi:glycosyltransferase involved in cell wall biosynthesis [Salinibacter ruber]|uniref:glycosyltransferase family 4 protein n=1 Tax=Salinibacter ruber TaxID=146919 RepID=UPI002167DCA9|nr:glycosyltransferase family 4 protein [Salinibacter ruber]MCS4086112.1 glycosyltransferase involved in cell wall biosynthesis [Salinibacter ruber]